MSKQYLLVDKGEEGGFIHQNEVCSYKCMRHVISPDNSCRYGIMLSALYCVMDVSSNSSCVQSMLYLWQSIASKIESHVFRLGFSLWFLKYIALDELQNLRDSSERQFVTYKQSVYYLLLSTHPQFREAERSSSTKTKMGQQQNVFQPQKRPT